MRSERIAAMGNTQVHVPRFPALVLLLSGVEAAPKR
jgi:hypothetical protein